jgi:FkbM family methyltransferase
VKTDLIYDVGVYNGDDTAYYLAKGFRVIGIEANPRMVEQTSRRFEQEIATGKLIILNTGVSDREGDLPFYISDTNPDWSTFDSSVIQEKNGRFRQAIVSCRRFRSILNEFGTPYYLKLDIEASEIHCLRDLVVSDLPNYISFEKTAQFTVESLTLLHDLGYTGFKLISQDNLLPVEYPPSWEQRRFERWQNILKSTNLFLRIVRRAGARRWIDPIRHQSDWVFPQGSSGPFGEDTAGKWQSFDEIVETLAKANSSFDEREPSVFWGNDGYSFWADFHARRKPQSAHTKP